MENGKETIKLRRNEDGMKREIEGERKMEEEYINGEGRKKGSCVKGRVLLEES